MQLTEASATIVGKVLSKRRMGRRIPSYREFCGTVKIYAGPAHVKGTPYRYGSDPCQAFLLDQFDSGKWKRFFVCAPPQFGGKTLTAIVIPMLRQAIGARVPVGYGLPTLADLDKAWTEKLRPALKDSGYGTHLPTAGPGARGGRGHTLQLTDPESGEAEGLIVFLAGGGYGSTVCAALIDEVDQFRTTAGDPNWGAIEDIFNRANAYGSSAIRIAAGTIEDDERSVILPLVFEQGTGTIPHPRCPHCRAWVLLNFDDMVIDFTNEDTAASSVVLPCPRCKVPWNENDRLRALRDCRFPHQGQVVTVDGTVAGPEPRTQSLGLWWSALESPQASMPDLAREWYRAKVAIDLRNDHSLMRKFWRYRRCRQYVEPEPDGEINNTTLAHGSDRSTVNKRTVPAWATFLTMAQDVQGDRHYWLVVAHGPGERWAVIDWGYELLVQRSKDDSREVERAPTPADRRRVLNVIRDLASAGWQVEGTDQRMSPVQRGVDGGYLPEELASWIQGEPAWKFLRGVGKDEVKHAAGGHEKRLPAEIRATKALQAVKPPGWRVYWWKIDGHHFRRGAHAALLRDPDQPASGMVPRGLKANDALLLHLSGEVWDEGKEGKAGYWREARKRHDWLDCLVYALALALLHRHAPDRRDESETPEGTELPQAPRPADAGWINGASSVGSEDSWI